MAMCFWETAEVLCCNCRPPLCDSCAMSGGVCTTTVCPGATCCKSGGVLLCWIRCTCCVVTTPPADTVCRLTGTACSDPAGSVSVVMTVCRPLAVGMTLTTCCCGAVTTCCSTGAAVA